MTAQIPEGASTPGVDVDALCASLLQLGVPISDNSQIEWMLGYPRASSLLHALSVGRLPATSVLTESESTTYREQAPSAATARAAAIVAPVLRDKGPKRARTAAISAARERVERLCALRDSLVAHATKADERALAAASAAPPLADAFGEVDPLDTDCSSLARSLSAVAHARNVRKSLSTPEFVLPPNATPSVSAALTAERRNLYAALTVAAETRVAADKATMADTEAAQKILNNFAPLLDIAASRRTESPAQGLAAANKARRDVTLQLTARSRSRHASAVQTTAEALASVADLRVRLDALTHALAGRRQRLVMLASAAEKAQSAAPPPQRAPRQSAAHDVRALRDRIAAVGATYTNAQSELPSLWPVSTTKSNSKSVEDDAELAALVELLSARLSTAVSNTDVAASDCAVRPLEQLERLVARNANALDKLMRERRAAAPNRSRAVAQHADSLQNYGDATKAQTDAAARYRAVYELHINSAEPRRNRYLGHRDKIDGTVPHDDDRTRSDRLSSFRSMRSALSITPRSPRSSSRTRESRN